MRPFFNQDNLSLQILSAFESQHSWTYTDLAMNLNVDRATLTKATKNLTAQINAQKIDDIQLQVSKQRLVYQRNTNFNLATLIPMLTDQRSAIIFESSFNEHYQTITALANKLYVSDSTTRRLLSNVNETLHDYQIQIDPKTLQLTGNESNIRYASFQYYWNTYGSVTWPFFVKQSEMKQPDIEDYDKLRFTFWLAICKQRQLKKHFVQNGEHNFIKLIKQCDFLPNNHQPNIIQKYAATFGNVPLLYDRQAQLNNYLKYITPARQTLLFQKYNHNKLLILKACETGNYQTEVTFQLFIDSDNFSRQKMIQELSNHFTNLSFKITKLQPDIILTNLTLRASETPTVFINVPLQSNDLTLIDQQIQKLLQK